VFNKLISDFFVASGIGVSILTSLLGLLLPYRKFLPKTSATQPGKSKGPAPLRGAGVDRDRTGQRRHRSTWSEAGVRRLEVDSSGSHGLRRACSDSYPPSMDLSEWPDPQIR